MISTRLSQKLFRKRLTQPRFLYPTILTILYGLNEAIKVIAVIIMMIGNHIR